MPRADSYLVAQGIFESRAKAAAAIKAGGVTADGRLIKKPSQNIANGASVNAVAAHPWVSRGGIKLDYALDHFSVSARGRICLDVGASTGGFVDVLLSRGAKTVYGVDVGRDQLHAKLRNDARVISMEGQDARELTAQMISPLPSLIVCDASFISMTKVLERALSLAEAGTDLVTLVKPQFEVGRKNIGKGGIVKSEEVALEALQFVQDWLDIQGWSVKDTTTSPITGGSGNTEYLCHAVKA